MIIYLAHKNFHSSLSDSAHAIITNTFTAVINAFVLDAWIGARDSLV